MNTVTVLKHVSAINNDLEGKVLITGILEKNWSLNSCYEYITKNKKIDETENYGFTKQIIKGEITPVEANNFVDKKVWLDNDYEHSFKILEKAYSYHINCVELPNLPEHINTVDAIVTSGPYYQLRGYQSELEVQLGHEKTKEEFCDNFAAIIGKLIPLLKETANVFFNIGETYDDGVGLGIPQLLKSTIESKTSLIYKDTIYWQKKNPKPPVRGRGKAPVKRREPEAARASAREQKAAARAPARGRAGGRERGAAPDRGVPAEGAADRSRAATSSWICCTTSISNAARGCTRCASTRP